MVNVSTGRERQRHVVNALARFHPHQHATLAGLTRLSDLILNIARVRYGLTADAHNHVAGFEAPLGRGTAGIDRSHRHPVVVG